MAAPAAGQGWTSTTISAISKSALAPWSGDSLRRDRQISLEVANLVVTGPVQGRFAPTTRGRVGGVYVRGFRGSRKINSSKGHVGGPRGTGHHIYNRSLFLFPL